MDLNVPPTTQHVDLQSAPWNLSSKQPVQQHQQQQQQQQISNGIGKISRSASNEDGDLLSVSIKNIDTGKRKKSKSRNATVPPNPASKKDLDEWLESCMEDAAGGPQLSSSSEFLDYNPSSFNTNKKNSPPLFTKSQRNPNAINQIFKKLQTAQEIPAYHFNYNKMQSHHMQNDLEFASLPPIVNYGPNGGESNCDNLDLNDPTRSFRFSDPCLIVPSDTDSKISGKNSPEAKSFENQIGNNKFLATLLEQINLLHETNSKICRNLHETKVEIEAIKHAPNWGLRHRRDSLSGLSTHSQPMGFAFGTQSPAPTYHSGMYTPGAMTDVVREVKEAARVREEALLSRVKAMVEERSWSTAESNIRMMRDIEELKAQIQHLRSDRKDSNKRIAQLESENKYIRSILGSILNNRTTEIIHENDMLRSTPIRKNFGENSRPKHHQPQRNSFNLNYGTINYEDGLGTTISNERHALQKSASIDSSKLDQIKQDRRTSYGASDGLVSQQQQNGSFRIDNTYNSTQNEPDGGSDDGHLLQIQNDTIDLRRELQDALASKKQAENRIIALESIVRRLQVKGSTTTFHHNDNLMNGSISSIGPNDLSQNNSHSSSQIQNMPSKLSLAGPITDL